MPPPAEILIRGFTLRRRAETKVYKIGGELFRVYVAGASRLRWD